jgi:superfamily II DNA or RNA helicase
LGDKRTKAISNVLPFSNLSYAMIVSTKQPFQLVYSIFQHQYLGLLFETFVIQLNDKGEFTYSYQNVSAKNIEEFAERLDPVDFELVEIIDDMTQDGILQQYNTKRLSSVDFFLKNYGPEKGDRNLVLSIEAQVEKCRSKVLRRLDGRQQVFEMRDDGFPAGTRIEVKEIPAKVYFHFDRREEETYYYPIVKSGAEKVKFQFKNGIILSNSPAYLLVEHKIYAFDKRVDANKLKPFLDKPNIIIKRAIEKTYFKKFVAPLIAQFNVYAKGFEIIKKEFEAFPVLQLKELVTTDEVSDIIVISLQFSYNGVNYDYDTGMANSYVNVIQEGESWIFEKIMRDWSRENGVINWLTKNGLDISSGTVRVKKQAAFSWLQQHHDDLEKHGIKIEQSSETDKKYFVGYSSLDIRIEEKNDWFDIKAKVVFGEYEIPFVQLRKYILAGQTEFRLPNGQIAVIPEEWFARYADLLTFVDEGDDDEFRLQKHHIATVQRLEQDGLATTIISRKLEQLRDFDKIEPVELPSGFKGELRPYQKAGYDWLHFLKKYKFGGCLADDMGLGKTVMTLAFLQSLKESGEMQKPTLLVMPTSLIYNWQKEAEKFTPELKILIHVGSNREKNTTHFDDYDLVLMSYGILRIDIEFIKQHRFTYAILDESQVIKNPSANISQAVRELNVNYRLILTGTPLENSTLDLWSQMTFTNPGLLGSQVYFKENYQYPIEKKQDEDAIRKLYAKIKPFMLRRQKSQVATELPEKVENVFYSDMTEEQAHVYEETKSYYRNLLLEQIEQKGIGKAQFMVLQGLTKLRQLANDPRMIDADYQGSSGKGEDVLHQLLNIVKNGHKVLIFSQYVKHLQLFKNYLDTNEIAYCYLDGSTKKRQEIVDRFQTDESTKVFLISLKAGGVGLNLTAAEYVFILDPWWNPAVEAQAIDRAHRIGQEKTVFTYKFITRNTVEEKILALQRSKKRLFNELITTEDTFVKSLSKTDVLDLLS